MKMENDPFSIPTNGSSKRKTGKDAAAKIDPNDT
jgi:hypothetical protein